MAFPPADKRLGHRLAAGSFIALAILLPALIAFSDIAAPLATGEKERIVATFSSSATHATPLEFFYGIPSVVVAFWALAVWGGVAGTILLLLRKRHATPVLLTSFLCMVVTSIHNFGLANGLEVMGGTGLMFSGLIFVFALGLFTAPLIIEEQTPDPGAETIQALSQDVRSFEARLTSMEEDPAQETVGKFFVPEIREVTCHHRG